MLSDAASDGSGMASEGPDLDMGALATRIADVQALPAPEAVRIFDLDAMVPRQRLAFDAPQAFVDQLDQAEADGGKALVMVGRELSALNSHGVEVEVETVQRRSDGTGAAVTLVAGRFCEVISVGDDEGSRWLGRSGTVCWVSLDADSPEEAPTEALIEQGRQLEGLTVELALTRTLNSPLRFP